LSAENDAAIDLNHQRAGLFQGRANTRSTADRDLLRDSTLSIAEMAGIGLSAGLEGEADLVADIGRALAAV